MRSHLVIAAGLAAAVTASWIGCQPEESETNDDGSGASGPSGSGGEPGTGGQMTTTTTTTNATGGAGGTGGGGTGGQGQGGVIMGDCSQVGNDHLLINEVAIGANDAEFIEIYNPGSTTVDLTGYYLSDNQIYFRIAAGTAFMPIYNGGNMGSDFLVAFPPGETIAPGAYLTISTGVNYSGEYPDCPAWALLPGQTCQAQAVPPMQWPLNGDPGTAAGTMLSNGGEMLMLFCWDGAAGTVKDVDYVNWDDDATDQTHVYKTGEAGYLDDTAVATQIQNRVVPPPAAGAQFGIERCSGEDGETQSGGNGIANHDETSENWSSSWQISQTRTPNGANSCQ